MFSVVVLVVVAGGGGGGGGCGDEKVGERVIGV